MRRVALKGLWLRRGRALLTTFAVVLGVAMVCGTYILTDTIDKAFSSIFASANAKTSAVVTARGAISEANSGLATVPASLLDEVRAVDDVEEATGTVEAAGFGTDQVRLVIDGETVGSENAPRLGVGADFAGSQRLNPFTLEDGELPGRRPRDRAAAGSRRRRGPGGRRSRSASPPREAPRTFEVVGIARFGDVDSLGGATFGLFDLATAPATAGQGEPAQHDLGGSRERGAGRSAQVVAAGGARRTTCASAPATSRPPPTPRTSRRHCRSSATSCSRSASSRSASARSSSTTRSPSRSPSACASSRRCGRSARPAGRCAAPSCSRASCSACSPRSVGLVARLLPRPGPVGDCSSRSASTCRRPTRCVKPRTIVVSLAIGIVVTAVASHRAGAARDAHQPGRGDAGGGEAAGQARHAPSARRACAVLVLAAALLGDRRLRVGVDVGLGLLLIAVGDARAVRRRDDARPPRRDARWPPCSARPRAGSAAPRDGSRRATPLATRRARPATAGALMIGLALVTLVATLGEGLRSSSREAVEDAGEGADFVVVSANGFDTVPRGGRARRSPRSPGAEVFPVRDERARAFGKASDRQRRGAGHRAGVTNRRGRAGSREAVLERDYASRRTTSRSGSASR